MDEPTELEAWRDDVVSKLQQMIREWEETMGADDQTFYSLALRRAVDVVLGKSAMDQLPVLEKPDTVIDSD